MFIFSQTSEKCRHYIIAVAPTSNFGALVQEMSDSSNGLDSVFTVIMMFFLKHNLLPFLTVKTLLKNNLEIYSNLINVFPD